MVDISGNIRYLKSIIPEHVKLVAVSKLKTVGDILEAYNGGQRCFGENRVQEILSKKELMNPDIEWHLIGHLQGNKVKLIVPFISMIQSVDTFKLLATINSEALKVNRVVDCLLQIYIADEDTKFGFSMKELIENGDLHVFENMKNVRICGVMGMATFTSDKDQVYKEFGFLSDCFRTLKNRYFINTPHFKEISMGMSGDFETAIKAGSTMVRIGSLIFGERIKK
jgi:pyridoxal phosphate enzyme (YggS family)